MTERKKNLTRRIAAMAGVGALAASGIVAMGSGAAASGGGETRSAAADDVALVIDARVARDGRELIDPRLRAAGAEIRVPRTAEEARTNVRYFAESGIPVVVAGPRATAAARAVGVRAEQAADTAAALAVLER